MNFSKDQIFLVAGASSGIGEAITLLLNRCGATVIGLGRNEQRLAALRDKAERPERLFTEAKDLSEDIAGLPDFVRSLRSKYGKMSGLAYSAGIPQIMPLSALEYSEVLDVFSINYFAPIMLLKGFLDRRNNIGKGAAAVLISSAAAKVFDRGHTSYCGSKAALCASCGSIAKEVAQFRMRINCLLPSDIDTPMTAAVKKLREDPSGKYPMGMGTPADVANMAVFLLSAEAKWISGQNYIIDCASI